MIIPGYDPLHVPPSSLFEAHAPVNDHLRVPPSSLFEACACLYACLLFAFTFTPVVGDSLCASLFTPCEGLLVSYTWTVSSPETQPYNP